MDGFSERVFTPYIFIVQFVNLLEYMRDGWLNAVQGKHCLYHYGGYLAIQENPIQAIASDRMSPTIAG